MALTDTLGIGVVISAKNRVGAPVKQATGAFGGLKTGILGSIVAARELVNVINSIGVAGRALLGFLSGSVQEFADLETAMTEVRKTGNLTNAQLAALTESTLDLSTKLPSTAVELGNIAAEGGRLGLSFAQLPKFQRLVAQSQIAMNIEARRGALLFARLNAIFPGTIDQGQKVGSALAAIADSAAASEPEIADIALRAGESAKQFGFTSQGLFALSAAVRESGIRVEAAGTSISKLFRKILLDPAKFARAAGVNVEQFTAAMNEAARTGQGGEKVMIAFFKALQDPNRSATKTQQVLKKLFGTNERLLAVTNQLVTGKALGRFNDLLIEGNEAFVKGTRLREETIKQLETWNAQIQILKNTFTAFRVELAATFAPVLKIVVGFFQQILEFFRGLSPETKKAIGVFLAIVGVIAIIAAKLALLFIAFVALKAAMTIAGISLAAIALIAGKVLLVIAALIVISSVG